MRRVFVKAPHGGRRFALVDDANAALCERRWHLTANGYAKRGSSRRDGPRHAVYMHREIMGLQKGDKRDVHHINHKKLDNRRCNLRITTRSYNLRRRRRRAQFVTRHSNADGWQARVMGDYLGSFRTREDGLEAVIDYLLEECR